MEKREGYEIAEPARRDVAEHAGNQPQEPVSTLIAAEGARSAPRWSPREVLALQRSAGNAAVARLVRRAAAGHRATPDRFLADPIVQRLVVAQVIPDLSTYAVIDDVVVVGRPKPVFGSSMGDHTTAFTTQVEALRTRLRGKSYEGALGEMNKLTSEMASLPGVALVGALPEEFATKYNAAVTTLVTTAAGMPPPSPSSSSSGPSARRDHWAALLNYVTAYLDCRELVPLSVINVAAKSSALAGKTKGESGLSEMLALHETGNAATAEDLRAAILGLFDTKAVALVAAEQDQGLLSRMAPGLDPRLGVEERMRRYIRQHLIAVGKGFPKAFADAALPPEQTETEVIGLMKPMVTESLLKDRGILVASKAAHDSKASNYNQDYQLAQVSGKRAQGAAAAVHDNYLKETAESARFASTIRVIDEMLMRWNVPPPPPKEPEQSGKRKRGAEEESGEASEDTAAEAGDTLEAEEAEAEQRKMPLAIQIMLGQDGTVAELRSGGRSPSPFSGTMGAHTTSWVVHLDRIRRAIIGKAPVLASQEIENTLIPEAEEMKKNLSMVTSGKHQQDLLSKAEATLGKVGEMAKKVGPASEVTLLQMYINALLTYLNFIPGATLEAADTGGKSEGRWRRVLKEHEADTPHKKEELQKAIAGLLDIKAAKTEAYRPLLDNHLKIVKKTYPQSYAASGIEELFKDLNAGQIEAGLADLVGEDADKEKRRGAKGDPSKRVKAEASTDAGSGAASSISSPSTVPSLYEQLTSGVGTQGTGYRPLVDEDGGILADAAATFIKAYRDDVATSNAYLTEAEGHVAAMALGVSTSLYRGQLPPDFTRISNPGGGDCLLHALIQLKKASREHLRVGRAEDAEIKELRRYISENLKNEDVLGLCAAAVMGRIHRAPEPGLGPQMQKLLTHWSIVLAQFTLQSEPPPASAPSQGESSTKAPASTPAVVKMPQLGDDQPPENFALLHDGSVHYEMIERTRTTEEEET